MRLTTLKLKLNWLRRIIIFIIILSIAPLIASAGVNYFQTSSYNYIGLVTEIPDAAYTLSIDNCGTTVKFTNAIAVSVTIPATLVAGCTIAVEQAGNGNVSFTGTAVPAATLVSAHNYTRTLRQWSIVDIFIDSNLGTAVANIAGDGA